jgi:hypothetical protein
MDARFYVQVRFNGERSWRTHDWWGRLHSAVDHASKLSRAKDADDTFYFPNVRIRYRGLTLERWKDGFIA